MTDRFPLPKKDDYKYLGQYKNPLIYGWTLQKWACNEEGKQYNLPKLDGRLLALDGHLFVYRSDWEAAENWTQQVVDRQDEKGFEAIFQLMDRVIRGMLDAAKKLGESEELQRELFESFFQAMKLMEYPWFYVLPMSEKLEEMLKTRIKKEGLSEEHLQSFFVLEKATPLVQQQREVVKIRDVLLKEGILEELKKLEPEQVMSVVEKKSSKLAGKITSHIEEYKWFGMMHMWGSPFSEDKFFEQLLVLPDKREKEKDDIKLPEDLGWLCKQTRELAYWRNYVAEACGMGSYLVLSKFQEACKKLGLAYEDLGAWLTPVELLSGLKEGSIPSRSELKKRKKAFGTMIVDGEIKILVGEDLRQVLDAVMEEVGDTDEIKGTAANPGKVRGLAKIVLSPDEIAKVKKGDILIAGETTPDFVPAMARAAAFVTDIGGITSHAAIMSREMNKPCIVGTKVATRVFNDGDELEVNADNGIVRRLS